MKFYIPSAISDVQEIFYLIKSKTPFTFIRFSDGEVELLRNRRLVIDDNNIVYKEKKFTHKFPAYDRKNFDPKLDYKIRELLLESLFYREDYYYKGFVVSSNNQRVDRDFLVRMNGGLDFFVTFSDLFVNSNYDYYRNNIVPLFFGRKNLFIVANFRANLNIYFTNANHISVPDDMFSTFEEVLDCCFKRLETVDAGSIILASASSLSNVLGYMLKKSRPDITFIDVGSSINDFIGLDAVTRGYHTMKFYDRNFSGYFNYLIKKFSREHTIKW